MLTIKDILIFNAIVYTRDFAISKSLVNHSLLDFANQYVYQNDLSDEPPCGIQAHTFNRIIQDIKRNAKKYKKIRILDIENSTFGDEQHVHPIVNATFLYKKTLIVIFKGTAGPLEWRDNGEGAYPQTLHTAQQENALIYYENMLMKYKRKFNAIIITGHSKGGNKAQFITVLKGKDKRLKHCYSINGQGFNRTFVKRYKDEIAFVNKKMISISNMYDFVNILLYPIIKNRIYLQSTHVFSNTRDTKTSIKKRFGGWHSLESLFCDEAKLNLNSVTYQSKLMQSIEQLLVHYLDTLQDEDIRFMYYHFASIMMKDAAKEYGEHYPKMPKQFHKRLYIASISYKEREDTYGFDEIMSYLKPIIQEVFDLVVLKNNKDISRFDQNVTYFALDDITNQPVTKTWLQKFFNK